MSIHTTYVTTSSATCAAAWSGSPLTSANTAPPTLRTLKSATISRQILYRRVMNNAVDEDLLPPTEPHDDARPRDSFARMAR